MFSGVNDLSFENEQKTRRGLLASSFALIVVSGLKLKSDTINVFGLVVVVEQQALVGAFKLVLIIMFAAYSIALLNRLPRELAKLLRKRDEKWWTPIEKEIEAYHYEPSPEDQYEDWHDGEWYIEFYNQKASRKQRRNRVLGLYRPIKNITSVISRIVWPFSLAAIAWFAPELVFNLTDWLAAESPVTRP